MRSYAVYLYFLNNQTRACKPSIFTLDKLHSIEYNLILVFMFHEIHLFPHAPVDVFS